MRYPAGDSLEYKLNQNAQFFLLVIITLLAGVLRFYKLGEWSFWGDEMITVDRVQGAFSNGITLTPASTLFTYMALGLFGTSEWTARLAPALVGMISVPILYFPFRKLAGPLVALLAVLLLAVAPWHLYWSQNARFYTTMLLFYTLALLTFYFGIEEDRPWYLLLSLFFTGLAMIERLSALLLIPVLVSYLALLKVLPIEKPPGFRMRNLALFFLPGAIPALFLALPYLQNPEKWWSTFAWVNNNPFWLLAGVIYYIGIPVICLGGLGALYLLTKQDRAALFLILGALVPLVLVLGISLFQYTANRYVFISLTSWLILASMALKELFLHTPKNARILTFGVLAIVLLMPLSENMLYYKYQHGNRDNWRGAFTYIKQHKSADDVVVVPNRRLADYYLEERVVDMSEADLTHIQENGNRVWFVEDMNVQPKWPHVLDWINENTHQVAEMDVHVQARTFRMRVYLYDPGTPLPVRQQAQAEKQQ
jgi:mannosyltransferase